MSEPQPPLTETAIFNPPSSTPPNNPHETSDLTSVHPQIPHSHNELLIDESLRDFDVSQLPADVTRGSALGHIYVPNYEILSELGRGGMGVVYKARQDALNRVVALKMIIAGGHAPESAIVRLRAEAEAIAKLRHPNIIQVYDIGEADGLPFFAMEFCSGGGLDRLLTSNPWAPQEAAHLIEILARAMHVAHLAGIVHRDLKPANVLIEPLGLEVHTNTPNPTALSNSLVVHAEDGPMAFLPKITDFGLAKQADVGNTASGAILGTPSYMPPEQAGHSGPVGPHADVYSLGAILYELLTTRPPFKAANLLDTVRQVLSDDPIPPRRLQPATPIDLETICLKCLAKDPHRRYESALALAEDLRRFRGHEPITARPVSPLERGWRWCRRNPVTATSLASTVLTLVLAVIVSVRFATLAWQSEVEARMAQSQAEERAKEARIAHDLANARTAELAQERLTAQRNFYIAAMQLVPRAWEEGRISRVHELLQGQIPASAGVDHRGPEWFYWQRRCSTHRVMLSATQAVSFAHDGVVATDSGSEVIVHRITDKTVAPITKLSGLSRSVRRVALSVDGRICAASDGQHVAVWNVETAKLLANWPARLFALSPDGQRLALANANNLKQLRVKDGEVLDQTTFRTPLSALIYRPDSRSLVAAGEFGLQMLIPDKPPEVIVNESHPARHLAFSSDGRLLASDLNSGWVWELVTKSARALPADPLQLGVGAAFHPEGRFLILAHEDDESAELWNLAQQPPALIDRIRGHRGSLRDLTVSPDGKYFASVGPDGCRVWAWGGWGGERERPGLAGNFTLSPDGRTLATHGNVVRVRQIETGQELFSLEGDRPQFAAHGEILGVVALSGPIRFHHARTGQRLGEVAGTFHEFAFSQSGELGIAWNSENSQAHAVLHRVPAGKAIRSRSFAPMVVVAATFLPNTQQIAVVIQSSKSEIDELLLWNYETNEIDKVAVKILGGDVAVSPNGQLLAVVGPGHVVRLVDVPTRRVVRDLHGHSRGIDRIVFDPRFPRIYSSSSLDRTVRLWDIESGQELLMWRGHRSFTLSADGRSLGLSGESRIFVMDEP